MINKLTLPLLASTLVLAAPMASALAATTHESVRVPPAQTEMYRSSGYNSAIAANGAAAVRLQETMDENDHGAR